MDANVGLMDRFIRLVIALGIIIGMSHDLFRGSVPEIMIVVFYILLTTVILGICPIYKMLHIDTNIDHSQHHQ